MITSRGSEAAGHARQRPRFSSRERGDEDLDEPALLAADSDSAAPLPIPPGWSRIGRSPTADIQLDHPSVSRQHALLIRDPDEKLQIIDDRSSNGVRLNGEPVRWAELGDGDELLIGPVRLIVACGRAEDRPTA